MLKYSKSKLVSGLVLSSILLGGVSPIVNAQTTKLEVKDSVIDSKLSDEDKLAEDGVNFEAIVNNVVSQVNTVVKNYRESNESKSNIRKLLDSAPKIEDGYSNNEQFINMIATHRSIAKTMGIFPSVMVAQAVLESGAKGDSTLAKVSKNLYGIKGSYNGNSAKYSTLEDASIGDYYEIVDGFRVYPTYQESIIDYLRLLTNTDRYRHVKNAKSPQEQIKLIKEAGYATDGYYVDKIIEVIEYYNLERFD